MSSSNFKIIYFLLHFKEKINPTLSCKEIRIRIAKLKKLKDDITDLGFDKNHTEYYLGQLKEDNDKINNYFKNIEV